jgi:hypothetical protein
MLPVRISRRMTAVTRNSRMTPFCQCHQHRDSLAINECRQVLFHLSPVLLERVEIGLLAYPCRRGNIEIGSESANRRATILTLMIMSWGLSLTRCSASSRRNIRWVAATALVCNARPILDDDVIRCDGRGPREALKNPVRRQCPGRAGGTRFRIPGDNLPRFTLKGLVPNARFRLSSESHGLKRPASDP